MSVFILGLLKTGKSQKNPQGEGSELRGVRRWKPTKESLFIQTLLSVLPSPEIQMLFISGYTEDISHMSVFRLLQGERGHQRRLPVPFLKSLQLKTAEAPCFGVVCSEPHQTEITE